MLHMKYLFYLLILLHLIVAAPQINLYFTDAVSDNALRHDCLRLVISIAFNNIYEILSYCLSESALKFSVENKNFLTQLTFAELAKQNISSEQLYLWSTPIDIIERYQFYLNQLSTFNDLSLSEEIFYNCTMPRFGPMCQYEFYYHHPQHSSLFDIIFSFYRTYQYYPTNLTCYTQLECNRGSLPACLDWTEICDGQIDCLNDEIDEKYCWQLEVNQCEEDEFRCTNGQCIPQSLRQENSASSDCIDASDKLFIFRNQKKYCHQYSPPSLACEDITCTRTSLTSACVNRREILLLEAMYSNKDQSVSKECWSAFKCLIRFPDEDYNLCDEFCRQNGCLKIVQSTRCPDVLFFPKTPVLFDDIYFAYRKNDSHHWSSSDTTRFWICYTKSDYDDFFINVTMILYNKMKCIDFHSFQSQSNEWASLDRKSYPLYFEHASKLYQILKRFHLVFNYTSAICNRSNMYQCLRSSKCISIHRLMNNIADCPYIDDEHMIVVNNTELIQQLRKTHFQCPTSKKYIHQSLVNNHDCDCVDAEVSWCEDEQLHVNFIKRTILFQHICDRFDDLLPIIIEERNETDETECQHWECQNVYTRCNSLWNCPNGADEGGCISYSSVNCSSNHHFCISLRTKQLMCLPVEKANDGHVDCLGGTDEPELCRTHTQSNYQQLTNDFYCMNQSSQLCIYHGNLCDGCKDCEDGDDEQFCNSNGTFSTALDVCTNIGFASADVEHFMYNQPETVRSWEIIHFRLDRMSVFFDYSADEIENTPITTSPAIRIFDSPQPRCHRGLDLHVWLDDQNSSTTSTCLCPPSYYGDQCQYQNQRISLGLRFRALSDSWQTLFAMVISLIDDTNERIIHSYEQISFLSVRDCKTKFSMNLFYSTRPKDPTKHYAIHIDIYEKVSLAYRGSVLFPVLFPFLPVHRLAYIVHIPRNNDQTQSCSDDQCVHGKCIRYSDHFENKHFCQCNQGWTGRYCTLRHNCTCSSDSLCIGVSAHNRSVCVCPSTKFGSHCLLLDTIRRTNHSSLCQNGGQRIPNDDYTIYDPRVVCSCPRGFSGDLCELTDNTLILSFDESVDISQQIFLHFIEITYEGPTRATTFRMMPVKQDAVTIYWSQPFHLVFTEMFSKIYYLTFLQRKYNRSTTLVKRIDVSDRCPHISELFNETFLQWHLLRRIKYYHLPCQRQSLNLSCFYDDVHLCLCYEYGEKRLANCLIFDHNMTFNCKGQSECENGAQCLQDRPDCPTRSICMCPPCFYGTRCQFTTSGFGLSLDAILGYHILPHVSLRHQPFIIQMSLAWTIIFMLLGQINGVLSMITFKNKSVHEVGCGLYLLSSSITTLLTMTMFGLKFLMLLLTQMMTQSNRLALLFQCRSIDFILRICLCMDQWLNACVAVERATTSVKGARFNKRKSKQAAKFVIIILLIIIIGTSIHDPIYRQLIDEVNDDDNIKRIWCIAMYPSGLQVYNYMMHALHFSVPFMMNLISAIILIIKQSRAKATVCPQQTPRQHLHSQFRQHRHLLTGPIVLVILAVPRLIITFASKCMKSTGESWLFLVGYFISFIPPMLTFVVFIIPSKFYKKIFRNSVRRYRRNIQRHLSLN